MMFPKPKKRKNARHPKDVLWDLFSEYIRRRDSNEEGMGKCISCGSYLHWKQLQAGHYVARSICLALKFDERNVNAQCASCNCYDTRSITSYAVAMRKKYGESILEELETFRRENQNFRISMGEYREMIETYEQKLEAMK